MAHATYSYGLTDYIYISKQYFVYISLIKGKPLWPKV